jgi:hypothetical protein
VDPRECVPQLVQIPREQKEADDREFGGILGWTLESVCLNWFRYEEGKKKLMM